MVNVPRASHPTLDSWEHRSRLCIMHPKPTLAHQQGRTIYIYQRSSSIKERPNSCDKPKARKTLAEGEILIILHSRQPMLYHIVNHSEGQDDCSDWWFLFTHGPNGNWRRRPAQLLLACAPGIADHRWLDLRCFSQFWLIIRNTYIRVLEGLRPGLNESIKRTLVVSYSRAAASSWCLHYRSRW